MTTRRIDVIGGGPGGLFSARLIKLLRPEWQVTVHERGKPGETFGFGVGLTGATMRNVAAVDPDSAEDIHAVSYSGHGLELRSESGEAVPLHGARNLAIARGALLDILARRAAAVGVEFSYGRRVEVSELTGDVIIAADGARSAVREKLAAELGAQVTVGRGKYLWCGVGVALPDAIFAPVRSEHGLFVAHAYPYADGLSTFLVETDQETWERAGMHRAHAHTSRGESDQQSLRELERIFARELDGRELLGNRTTWSQFGTVTMRRWHHDNVVLIGDAAHTAHYTLGSGTKLAMEDAIALSQSLIDHTGIADAFAHYQQVRRPPVTRFQRLAGRSQAWWESFPRRSSLPVSRLAVSFMTRAGNLTLGHFAAENPDVVADALAEYGSGTAPGAGESLTEWIRTRPFRRGQVELARREVTEHDLDGWATAAVAVPVDDPRDAAVDALVAGACDAVAAGADVVRLTGRAERRAVLSRLAVAELVRWETGATTLVDVPEALDDDAAAGLVAGRCDLVRFTR